MKILDSQIIINCPGCKRDFKTQASDWLDNPQANEEEMIDIPSRGYIHDCSNCNCSVIISEKSSHAVII
jgi:hypothetical protein